MIKQGNELFTNRAEKSTKTKILLGKMKGLVFILKKNK